MFLGEPPASETTYAAYSADRKTDGYVSNITRLWCWRPDLDGSFSALRASLMGSSTLTERELAVLVSSAVGECNDSYCSLAWGPRLAKLTDNETAAQVIRGVPAPAHDSRPELVARGDLLHACARREGEHVGDDLADELEALVVLG